MASSFIRDRPYLSKDRIINLLLSDLVICPLCQGVLWLPEACEDCETTYCASCIKAWKIETPSEPTLCPNDGLQYIKRKCPPAINHILSKLQVICRYKPNGCSEILPYGYLETHEELCDYRLRTCSGCKAEIIKMNFNEHYSQCPVVSLTCPECNTVFQRQDQDEHTETKCLRIQLNQLRDEMMQNEQKTNVQINQIESQMNSFIEIIEQLK